MEIQFMLRDGNMMIESAKNNSEALMQRIAGDGRAAVFGLYIDCAGRAALYSNTETEEAAEVQRTMNRYGVPLLGFYSGVEVAPILGKSRGLDWTGVLAVFTEGRHDV
jgi:small ligand-binding sensory domain FIST